LAEESFRYAPLREALGRLLRVVRHRTGAVERAVAESLGYALAEDVLLRKPMPEQDVVRFDGYAVRAADVAGASPASPVFLRVVEGKLGEGEAVYVSTGSEIPEGADAVIPVERVRLLGDGRIEVRGRVERGENVIPRGSDVGLGEVVLRKGAVVGPFELKLLLDAGLRTVRIREKPRVAVFGVGSELTDDEREADGKKLDTLSIAVSILVERAGGVAERARTLPDDPEVIAASVSEALRGSDAVLTIGGVSVGRRDMSWRTISRIERCEEMVRGLMVHPGRVTSAVVIGGKPVVMLPGLVQSAVVGFLLVAAPLIRAVGGRDPLSPEPSVEAELAEDLRAEEFPSFKRVRFVELEEREGKRYARPLPCESYLLSPLLRSGGYVLVPEGVALLRRGERVSVRRPVELF